MSGLEPLGSLHRRIVSACEAVPAVGWSREELIVVVEAVEGIVRRRQLDEERPAAPVLKLARNKH
jgi:hypothetical protein